MIYITGDIHGDITRFKDPKLLKLGKNDALIICGDFGFIWNGSKEEQKLLKKIGRRRYNVLFVEGSHENYDLLEQYPEEEWCGGRTRLISGRLRQLMRGQVFGIAEKTVFTFGGGQSDENAELTEGENWWPREIPTEEELAEGIHNLEAANGEVDFIVTHEPPAKLHDFIDHKSGDVNHINTFLDKIYEKASFKKWFFGKLHLNKLVPPKYHAVYDAIVEADTTKIKRKKEQKTAKNIKKAEENNNG